MTALTDPWSTPDNPLGSQAPQPSYLARADLVEAGALAVAMTDAWAPGDVEPIAPEFGDTSHRDVMVDLAAEVLAAAYPQVTTAEEIDALAWRTVLINDQGHVQQRVVAPDNRLDHGGKPWSKPGGEMGRHRVGWTSAELAASGPWTVVFRGQS